MLYIIYLCERVGLKGKIAFCHDLVMKKVKESESERERERERMDEWVGCTVRVKEPEKKKREWGRVWRYRFVPILYCHNSLFSCYAAQKKSNQMKYCLARRRFLRTRRRPEILIDRGNESSAVPPACVVHDHRSPDESSINEPTRALNRFKRFARARGFFSDITFIPYIYTALYIYSVISRVLRAYIVQNYYKE